ncbi:MAG: FixH family protein [Alphaproteobacteria bacterium]|nr:FixH family protein [Alphaproteobacteria bacterium]MBV9694461.1 FixH family protein [Alphaproteobacteria bacterium]
MTLTGRAILLWLAAFFGVIVSVNAGFIWASVSTYRGEDEQKPYLQGVGYNRTLDRRAAQAKLGWVSHIEARRLASGAVRLVVTLRDRAGGPQSVAELDVELRHPADETRDHSLKLVERRKGEYVAQLSGVSGGAWDVVVSTPAGGPPFEASERLWLR